MTGSRHHSIIFCIVIIYFYCSCEYVMLREQGRDEFGVNITEVVRFHGDLTSEVFVSRTDKITLQICYRSETFSGRNIQILYRAVCE